MVDPFLDDVPVVKDQKAPGDSISSLFQKVKAKYGAKWVSMTKDKVHAAGLPEWTNAMETVKKGASIFMHVPGRFSSTLSLREIATFNLESIAALIVVDKGNTESSMRRLLTLENGRSKEEIALEAVMPELLSLAGTQSLVISQWATGLPSQHRFVSRLWEALAGGASLANAVNFANTMKTAANEEVVEEVTVTKVPKKPASKIDTSGSKKQGLGKKESTESLSSVSKSASVVDEAAAPVVKSWVRLSRVVYGFGACTYQSAE